MTSSERLDDLIKKNTERRNRERDSALGSQQKLILSFVMLTDSDDLAQNSSLASRRVWVLGSQSSHRRLQNDQQLSNVLCGYIGRKDQVADEVSIRSGYANGRFQGVPVQNGIAKSARAVQRGRITQNRYSHMLGLTICGFSRSAVTDLAKES